MSTNYQEHLMLHDPELPARWRGDIERHQCPICQGWGSASLIADVTGITADLTLGQRWACDSCWTEWQRQQLPLSDGDTFVTHEEWFCRFCELTGRDGGNRDAFLGRQYALEADRLRGVLSRYASDSAEATEAQARLVLVLARSAFPGSWDTLDITADGTDAATLLKLAPAPLPQTVGKWGDGPRYDWSKLPALNIALDTIELADEYETEICDGINEQHRADADDRGDYLYEQMKDRRMGL
jgi:hypothetical protein